MTKKIMLDIGHGGKDGGASAYGLLEKNINLDIGKRTKKYLDENYTGHETRMTRSSDIYLTLNERTNMSNKWKPDLFVSIHVNASGGTGFESFIFNRSVPDRTIRYRNIIHDAIISEAGVFNRGKKRANFHVLRETNAPAVLTENLFIDNKDEAELLKKSSFIQKLAVGHAKGIAEALNLAGGTVSSASNTKPSRPSKKPSSKPVTSKYTGSSVVDYLKSINADSSFRARTALAKRHGINNYKGTQAQNTLLLKKLRGQTTQSAPRRTSRPSTRAGLPSGVLKYGSRGKSVEQLQTALNAVNYKVGKVDGIYGRKTEDAVRRIQLMYEHEKRYVDGIYGPRTKRYIERLL